MLSASDSQRLFLGAGLAAITVGAAVGVLKWRGQLEQQRQQQRASSSSREHRAAPAQQQQRRQRHEDEERRRQEGGWPTWMPAQVPLPGGWVAQRKPSLDEEVRKGSSFEG